jgi:protein involved in polysaccharide export with SLBB domain
MDLGPYMTLVFRRVAMSLLMCLVALPGAAEERGKAQRGAEAGQAQGSAPAGAGNRGSSDPRQARDRQDEVGSGDKLKVTFFGNADLTREVHVQGDGTISLPMLGSFFVAARFAQDAQHPSDNVTVDVVEWRPIFATGSVSKPGAYPYVSGMTVLHAISVSGGFYRVADSDVFTFVNVTQNVSRVQEVQEQLKHHLVRLASLKAEKAGETVIKASPRLLEIAGQEDAKRLLAEEMRALSVRVEATAGERKTRQRQIELLRSELEGYGPQLREVMDALKSKKQYLRDLTALATKGYSRRFDIVNFESHVERLESERRGVVANSARIERDLARQEQELADFSLQRQIKIDDEISELQQKIKASEASLEAALQIVAQLGGENMLRAPARGQPKRSFAILRKIDGKDIFLNAELTTRLLPGDVVVVGGPHARDGDALATDGASLLDRSFAPASGAPSR